MNNYMNKSSGVLITALISLLSSVQAEDNVNVSVAGKLAIGTCNLQLDSGGISR